MFIFNLFNPGYWASMYASIINQIWPKPVVEKPAEPLEVEAEDPQDFDLDDEDAE